MARDKVTVYGDVNTLTWQKVNQMLPVLRVQRKRRVNQREFVGELIERFIDRAVEEFSHPGEEVR
jgi:hypothetical protein